MWLAQGNNTVTPVRLKPSVSSQALYHWANMLPIKAKNKVSSDLNSLSTECRLLITFANSLDQIRPDKTSRSNLFDTQMVFLKEFFEKVDYNQQTTKKDERFPRGQRVNKDCASRRTKNDRVQLGMDSTFLQNGFDYENVFLRSG